MLANIAAGTTVFVDADILIFALTNHPGMGIRSNLGKVGREKKPAYTYPFLKRKCTLSPFPPAHASTLRQDFVLIHAASVPIPSRIPADGREIRERRRVG